MLGMRMAGVLLAGLLACSPLAAQETQQGRLVRGALLWVLHHELGHALIHEYRLMAVGNEEDAADQFATLFLTQDLNAKMLVDSTYAAAQMFDGQWNLNAKSARRLPYHDEHALDKQRYYNVICLMYGREPRHFAALAQRIPDSRRQRCPAEYVKLKDAWGRLLGPHAAKLGEPRPEDRKGRVRLSVQPPRNPRLGPVYQAIRSDALWPAIAEMHAAKFPMRGDIVIRFQECGEANAAWTPNQRAIVMCYELAAQYQVIAARFGPR